MTSPDTWQKSSFSGGGQGDACVEIANFYTRVAIRDSKAPAQGTLSFPAEAFTAFMSNLKADTGCDTDAP
ncbi:DUF397 domain-containing protein [Streptomyces regalis]|uniref:Toxin-antitoxin system, toxin component n=1 Tax=Streptomyces regalis TaxID=68262 RepID=A0A0X3V633_9ACTN|nr:DUF397 domain-containing protein [Streptomyces regalis]KUL40263.1 toxin-antitoxin system, toxin component [Streptomyces regalis]